MKLTPFLLLIFLFTSILSANAQKYSNEFLNIGVGAKAQGLGGAIVANGNDVTGGYWNPAALTRMDFDKGFQLGAMHSEWFGGVGKYDYAGIAIPASEGRRAIGFSMVRFGIDDIPNTLSLYDSDGTVNYNNIKKISAADYAFLLSVAQKFNKISVGGNVKVIRRKIGEFAGSWGFGLDAAVHYQGDHWNFALVTRDVTNTFNAWTFNFTEKEKEILDLTNNKIPISSLELTRPQIVLGTGYRGNLNSKMTVAGEIDFVATTDGKRNTLISSAPISIAPAGGIELGYDKLIFARVGISDFQKEKTFANKQGAWTFKPAIGLGLKIQNITLDYAFTDVGDTRNKSYSHIISLMLNVKPKNRGSK
ncbi:MAG: hypothetical protein RLZZ292_12 [Bacteroidota bacterium]|jgi:hypothetical protein